MSRQIAITDIHGCAATFRQMIDEELGLNKDDELLLLGDYIDRGPDSKGVIDYIWKLADDGYQLQCLRGNHEQILLELQNDNWSLVNWMRYGGDATLLSFGVEEVRQVPRDYLDWLAQLDYSITTDTHILTHAGLNFQADNPMADKEAMLWIRGEPIDKDWLGDKKLVHGHTPTERGEIQTLFDRGFPVVDIDAGCVYTDRPGMGHLCAYDLTNEQLYFVPYNG